MLQESPVRPGTVDPWRQPGPRRDLWDQLESYYESLHTSSLAEGAAEDADLRQSFGPQQPGAPGVRTEARFEAKVMQALKIDAKNYPLHMRLYAVPALGLIHHEQRRAITNCYLEGMPVPTFAQIARKQGIGLSTAQRWLDQGKWAVICLLYDSSGHPVVPKELR